MYDYDSLSVVLTQDGDNVVNNYRLTFIDGSTKLFNDYYEAVLFSNNPLRAIEKAKIQLLVKSY